MTNPKKKYTLLLIASLGSAHATILFDGTPYTQNFNTLATSASNLQTGNASAPVWTNDSVLDGWYGGGSATLAERYAVLDGTTTSSGITTSQVGVGSMGSLNSTDRALAPFKRNNAAYIALGMINDTGSTLTELVITYTGEQWRDNAIQTAGQVGLDFTYQIGATDITSGTWTSVSALNYSAASVSDAGALDGNNSANRSVISYTITGLNVADGQSIWLRWGQRGSGNNASFVAVDDLTVAIPEPGTLALVGIALGTLLLARRRK